MCGMARCAPWLFTGQKQGCTHDRACQNVSRRSMCNTKHALQSSRTRVDVGVCLCLCQSLRARVLVWRCPYPWHLYLPPGSCLMSCLGPCLEAHCRFPSQWRSSAPRSCCLCLPHAAAQETEWTPPGSRPSRCPPGGAAARSTGSASTPPEDRGWAPLA